MKLLKQIPLLLILPALALADCSDYDLYAFHLEGCPQAKLGVDTAIPLCQQEQWKHLAFMDPRCYEKVEPKAECTDWECPAPYDTVMREPISGRIKIFYGSRELVDWFYRAARAGYGAAQSEIRKLRKKKR